MYTLRYVLYYQHTEVKWSSLSLQHVVVNPSCTTRLVYVMEGVRGKYIIVLY